jgi:hypothetical protein
LSASAVFKEIAEKIPAYEGLRYPLLKDESKPVQVKYPLQTAASNTGEALNDLRQKVERADESAAKIEVTPEVGHELFKIGVLTDKVPQFHLLAAGNPEPPTFAVSPLYQITVDKGLRQPPVAAPASVAAGD